MEITVYRVLGEIDPETGIAPIIYLCEGCADKFYDVDELHFISNMSGGGCCDECGQ